MTPRRTMKAAKVDTAPPPVREAPAPDGSEQAE